MVYLDSNILIYLFEEHPKYGERVVEIMDVLRPKHPFVCSTLTVTECLAQVTSIRLGTFHKMPGLKLVPLDDKLAAKAAQYQQEASLRIGDAIHLATAINQKADLLFTNDKQFAAAAKKYIAVKTL